jgi:hypothetical protein
MPPRVIQRLDAMLNFERYNGRVTGLSRVTNFRAITTNSCQPERSAQGSSDLNNFGMGFLTVCYHLT